MVRRYISEESMYKRAHEKDESHLRVNQITTMTITLEQYPFIDTQQLGYAFAKEIISTGSIWETYIEFYKVNNSQTHQGILSERHTLLYKKTTARHIKIYLSERHTLLYKKTTARHIKVFYPRDIHCFVKNNSQTHQDIPLRETYIASQKFNSQTHQDPIELSFDHNTSRIFYEQLARQASQSWRKLNESGLLQSLQLPPFARFSSTPMQWKGVLFAIICHLKN